MTLDCELPIKKNVDHRETGYKTLECLDRNSSRLTAEDIFKLFFDILSENVQFV